MKRVKEELVKSRMTYDEWLKKYKGKSVHDLYVDEHTKYSKEFQAWKRGNIEKVAGVWWNR